MAVAADSKSQTPISLPPLTDRPLISVVVANFNYGRFLPAAIDSVLEQTYDNWELIICDDGSTDDSRTVIQRAARRDARIRPVFKENGGQASAWNAAIERANGEIIALLDADDLYESHKLETVVQTFREYPRSGLLYHPLQAVNAAGVPVGGSWPSDLPSGWLRDLAIERGGRAFLASTTMAFRRELARNLFPIPDALGAYGDMFIGKSASFLTEIAAIPEALTYYRIHGENDSGVGFVDPLHAPTIERHVESQLVSFKFQRDFIGREFGEAVAKRLCLDDSPELWDMLARLYILHAKPAQGMLGFSPSLIARNVKRSRKRYVWKAVFSLPHPVSLWLLRLQVRSLSAVRKLTWYLGRRFAVLKNSPFA